MSRVVVGGLNDQQHNAISRLALCDDHLYKVGVNGQMAHYN